jgi:acid phosphatase type 7
MRAALAVLIAATCLLAACGGSGAATATRRTGAFFPDGPRRAASVWAVGDGADGGPGALAVARLVKRAKPGAFLYIGDVYPEGDADAFAHSYAPTYGMLAHITAPTPGNHDESVRSQGYIPYWTKIRGERPPPYYSFRAGGWQILSLNSEIPTRRGSPQLRWLDGQLRAPGDCRLAFWHRPRFSAGTVHGDNPSVQPLWQALSGHARLVLNGHEHDTQRMRPRDGLVEIVAGAGGHSFYGLKRSYPGLAFANDNTFAALRIELRPGLARVAVVDFEGRTLDRTSVSCRGL